VEILWTAGANLVEIQTPEKFLRTNSVWIVSAPAVDAAFAPRFA
jgi:hypothetical protein